MIIDIDTAVEKLVQGGNVAIPTETVYGLAARFDQEAAVKNIFTIKARPDFDPLICHISSTDMLAQLSDQMNPTIQKLTDAFWPGPLSIVLPKLDNVSDIITSGLKTVAIRMPSHPIARKIIESVGVPLCAPSANRFSKTSPTTAMDVLTEFDHKVSVVDGGSCEVGIESTIIKIIDNRVEILRPGQITKEQIANLGLDVSYSQSKENSPGNLKNHYMPETPFYLLKKGQDTSSIKEKELVYWDLEKDAILAARNLYKNLRLQSQNSKAFYTFIEEKEDNENWLAIWDRLKKASYRKDLF